MAERSIKAEDIGFYFDAEERNRIDLGHRAQRMSQWLAMREVLLRVDDQTFDAVITAVRSMTQGVLPDKRMNIAQEQASALRELIDPNAVRQASTSDKIGKI